jgi:hypothetical protein
LAIIRRGSQREQARSAQPVGFAVDHSADFEAPVANPQHIADGDIQAVEQIGSNSGAP